MDNNNTTRGQILAEQIIKGTEENREITLAQVLDTLIDCDLRTFSGEKDGRSWSGVSFSTKEGNFVNFNNKGWKMEKPKKEETKSNTDI